MATFSLVTFCSMVMLVLDVMTFPVVVFSNTGIQYSRFLCCLMYLSAVVMNHPGQIANTRMES